MCACVRPRSSPRARKPRPRAGRSAPRAERLGTRRQQQAARRDPALERRRLRAHRADRRTGVGRPVIGWWQRWRRARALERRAIPDALWQLTLARFPFLAARSAEQVEALREMATLFLAQKE